MRVRDAGPADARAIVPLLEELGYATTVDALARRLDLSTERHNAAWLAVETVDGEDVIGFAAGHRFWPYELDDPVAELTALVVSDRARRRGTGRGLVETFERWASDHGCVRVSVATSFARDEAHAFYESLGYRQLARKYEKNR